MVMISLSASPACGPRFLAGWASWLSSRASQCGPKVWQKSSNWQTSSTSRSNMDASPHLMAPTQKEEFKGDKGLASLQTRNSGYFTLRRHLGGSYLALLQFFLNHRCFMRSRRAERNGKSPRELMTGQDHQHWLTLLGLGPLQPRGA